MDKFELKDNVAGIIEKNRNPDDNLNLKGIYWVEVTDKDGKLKYKFPLLNTIVNEGKNKILDVMFNDAAQIANNSWFIGLMDNAGYSSNPVTDTASSHAGWAEFTGYSDSTRRAWGSGAASSQSVTNAAAATFNINATGTLKGIFVITNSAKGGSTGVLWSSSTFPSTLSVTNGDQVKITYTVNA